jgi:hypothetical protein
VSPDVHPSLDQIFCIARLRGVHPLVLALYVSVVYRTRNSVLHRRVGESLDPLHLSRALCREYKIPRVVETWDDGG